MKCVRERTRHTLTDYKTDTATAKDLSITSVRTNYRNTEEAGCNI